jgi:hypothetical protein
MEKFKVFVGSLFFFAFFVGWVTSSPNLRRSAAVIDLDVGAQSLSFYQNKSIRLIVADSPGTGNDAGHAFSLLTCRSTSPEIQLSSYRTSPERGEDWRLTKYTALPSRMV